MDKQIWMSSTVRAIVFLAGMALARTGVDIAEDEQKTITDAVVAILSAGSILYFAVRGIIGRIKARRDLKLGSKQL